MIARRSAALAALCVTIAAPAPAQELTAPFDAPEHRAFDFWKGEWRAQWQVRDQDSLDSYSDWVVMRHRVMPILDGKAMLELAEPFDGGEGRRGFSIRYLDEASGDWIMAQHWPTPDQSGIAFLDQLRGQSFESRRVVYGKQPLPPGQEPPMRRYTFADISPGSFLWAMDVTANNGAQWTRPLVMHFRRISETASPFVAEGKWFGQADGANCKGEAHRKLDGLAGKWAGLAGERTITAEFSPMLDGCAIGGFMRTAGSDQFIAFSLAEQQNRWVRISLSDVSGEGHRYHIANAGDDTLAFVASPDTTIAVPEGNHLSAPVTGLERETWTFESEDRLAITTETRVDIESPWANPVTAYLRRVK